MRQAAGFRSSIALVAALLAHAGTHATPPAVPVGPAAAAAPVAASASAPLTDACPAQLPVTQTVSQPIPGWTPLDQRGNYPFVRVAFFPGPPTDASLIVPTTEYKGTAGLHDGWDLPHRATGYWMTCAYANTTAVVARKLADDVDFCQADYDGRFLSLVVKRWSCGAKRTMALPAWARYTPKAVKPSAKAATRRSD